MSEDDVNPLENVKMAAFRYARAQRLLAHAKPTLKNDRFVAMQEEGNGLKKELDRAASETSWSGSMSYAQVNRAIVAGKSEGYQEAEEQRANARSEDQPSGYER